MLKVERRQFIHRPQVAFLPLHEDKGTVATAPQASLAVKAPQKKMHADSVEHSSAVI